MNGFVPLLRFVWIAGLLSIGGAGHAQPAYTSDGSLQKPSQYREWIYLSTGLDMSYSAAASAGDHSMFDNVFVDPASYRGFLQTGHWPDGTRLALEIRGAGSQSSINKRGHFQTGEVMGLEVHVLDKKRFNGGWAFFSFDGNGPGKLIPTRAACYACHRDHAAVDTTFVQFYPTLLPVAKRFGTVTKD